jgi:hypothetical protein
MIATCTGVATEGLIEHRKIDKSRIEDYTVKSVISRLRRKLWVLQK